MQKEPEPLDAVGLARQMGSLAYCHNALVSVAEARTRLAMLGGEEEQGLLASLELTHRALAIQVAGLARKLGQELANVQRLAEGQEPILAWVG